MWSTLQLEITSIENMATRNFASAGFICVLALTLGLSIAQRLPSRDEDHFHFHISHTEIFYDTKLLPDGAEVITYMNKGVSRRFFFQVEESYSPLAITVTPCAAPVIWNLTLNQLPSELVQYDQDDEEEDELLLQRPSEQERPILLHSYEGSTVETFLTDEGEAGVYIIALESPEASGTVRLYATTTPHSDYAYPMVPRDHTLSLANVGKHTLSLTWLPSPSATLQGQDISYCVAYNTERPYETQCAATSHISGDPPPTPPPGAGFGFAWEKEQHERIIDNRKRARYRRPEDAHHVCIGSKTSYTLNGLQAAQHYHINVFAVNRLNNRSSAYAGLEQTTKGNNKRTRLPEDKVITGFIKRKDGYKLYKLKVRRPTGKLQIAVQPCFGELSFELSIGGEVLERHTVHDFQQFTLHDVSSGNYLIKVSTRRRRSIYFNLVATRRSSRMPYPMLPNDTSIKVFERQTTCSSLTVAWLGTEQKYRYCLYAKEVPLDEDPLQKLLKQWNKCMDPASRKRTEKVTCRNVKFKDKNRAVITERIRGLKPNSRYILDVYATKRNRGGQTLLYKTTEATTRERC